MTEGAGVLAGWESFYVIVGSSGGALIGLQFVVITLLAERRGLASTGGLHAFATPTVVHFAGALVIAALMSAPWQSSPALSFVMGATGFAGIAYTLVVLRRALRQKSYEPVWEDWLWYFALPGICYTLVLIAGFAGAMERAPLFVIAASALGLLLIGIHNAWDSVTHIVLSDAEGTKGKTDAPVSVTTNSVAPVMTVATATPTPTDVAPPSPGAAAAVPPSSPDRGDPST